MMQLADKYAVRPSRLCLLWVAVVSSCSIGVSDGVLGVLSRDERRSDGAVATPDAVPDAPSGSERPADSGIAAVDTALDGPPEREETVDSGTAPVKGCVLTSPLVTQKDHPTCTGRLAATRFSNALCVCKDLQLGAELTTHGFDSSQGPYQAGQSDDGGAAVGVNGGYSALTGATNIAGSFSVAGPIDVRFVGVLKVRGDLSAAGNVFVTGGTTVGRNAWLGGGFTGIGPLTVVGDLHHAGTVIAIPISAASNRKEAVAVSAPCPCGTSEILDVAALVDAAKLDNDNAKLGVSANAFTSVVGVSRWTLPCGRVYLSQLGGMGNLTVEVTGLAALFVDGSIDLKGRLAFELAPGAEIDVFVKQDLLVQGGVSLSDKDRPAAGRIWVGGTQPITLTSPWTGNLYAPRARINAVGGLEVWGAIFAGDFAGGAFASFIFDRAVLDAGTSCRAPRPPAGMCTKCDGCSGGTACIAGQCRPCHVDSDCCSLSVCANGSCVPLLDPA